MKTYVVLFLLSVLSCNNSSPETVTVYQMLPKASTALLKINNLASFNAQLNTQLGLKQTITEAFNFNSADFLFLNPKAPIYIAKIKKKSPLLITKFDSTLVRSPFKLAPIEGNPLIKKLPTGGTVVYLKIHNGFLFATKDIEQLRHIEFNPVTGFKTLTKSDRSALANIWFRANNTALRTLFIGTHQALKPIKNTCVDLHLNANGFWYTGVSQNANTAHFSTTENVSIGDLNIPITTLKFSKQLPSKTPVVSDTIVQNITAHANVLIYITLADGKLVALQTNDTLKKFQHVIQNTETQTNYQGQTIYTLTKDVVFTNPSKATYRYVLWYKEYIVFAETTSALQTFIDAQNSANTITNTDAYKTLKPYISTDADHTFFTNYAALSPDTNTLSYNASLIQFNSIQEHSLINGVYSLKEVNASVKNEITRLNFTLPAQALNSPEHIPLNGFNAIAIQDVNNRLYLINTSGVLLWKKQLNSKIMSSISYLGATKTRNEGIAFNTLKNLYVLDNNGNAMGDFPKQFNDPITQALSVFDYDNTKDYRLLITQNNTLHMYDAKGRIVKGFKYTPQKSITDQPQHFRIRQKDYIVFKSKDQLTILNRRGAIRVKVKQNIDFSDQPIYNHHNMFTTLNAKGQLIQVNTKGIVSSKSVYIGETSRIVARQKMLVSLTDNVLKINAKAIPLQYGNYTAPQLHKLNNKMYISTTDLQAKKLYVFDSKANLVAGFPIYGRSKASIFTSNQNRYLATLTDTKTLSIYNF